MKKLYFFAFISMGFLAACSGTGENDDKSLPLKVAEAYGYDQMDQIEVLQYTWNVRGQDNAIRSRSWEWNLKTGEVSYAGPDTTLSYSHSEVDSSLKAIDQRFINDKYWLLFPFQLAWDTGYDFEVLPDQAAPISGKSATKLTVLYNNADGYTPGDAYDLFLDENHRIIEWVFRRGNAETGRALSWENVQDFNGVKIALDHKDNTGNTVLWFSGVSVK